MPSQDFTRWTEDTATCYFNRMQCSICANKTACDIGDRNFKKVGEMYGLRKIKEAVLRIYANIGLKGIERFRNINESEE